jgi:type II secretory pathway pseudopilin PulG
LSKGRAPKPFSLASTCSASAFISVHEPAPWRACRAIEGRPSVPELVEGPGSKTHLACFGRLSKPGSSGVTLVEILVSLTILVLVTSALSSGTNYLTRRLVRAKNAAVARNLAWKRLAEIKSARIESGHNSGIFGRDFPDYKFVETIEPAVVDGQKILNLFEYELTVIWPEAWQEDRLTLTTLVADYQQDQAIPEAADGKAKSE